MKNITINTITVDANGGSLRSDCIAEAIILAIEQDVTVILTHNNKEYVVLPNEVKATILERDAKPRD